MEPSFHNMEFVLLDKRKQVVQPGDVVAFWSEGLHAVLVKRVVACPGETVMIRGGKLLVDGKEPALYERAVFTYEGILSEPIALSSGEYIVIGDNIEFGEKDMMPKYLNNIQKKTFIIEAASSNVVESNLTMFYDRGIKDIF